jgi:two-component system NarL family response regulator
MSAISVFVCDDHEILRKGLRALFGTVSDLQWIGEASDGESTLARVTELKPDVILLDLLMPGLSEIELIRQVKNASPASKILILTSSQEEDTVIGCLEAGANGYLLKTCSPDILIQGIRDVMAGSMVMSVYLLKNLPSMLHNQREGKLLSQREIQVVKLIGQGQSNRMIALALHLSENTIVSHVARILDKLGLENRTQVAIYARRRGLV